MCTEELITNFFLSVFYLEEAVLFSIVKKSGFPFGMNSPAIW